jgi:hypothetical protein
MFMKESNKRMEAARSSVFAPVMLAIFIAILFTGCGNSENFVFTGTNPNPPAPSQLGSLTYNFVLAQEVFTAPSGTTDVRFQLYTGPNGTGTLNDTINRPFANQIVLTDVSTAVQSTVITFYGANGIPLLQVVTASQVVSDENTVVVYSDLVGTVPTFDTFTVSPGLTVLNVADTAQIEVVAEYSTGDVVTLTGNSTSGVTYTPAAPGIVSVSNGGLVTADAVGLVNITVELTSNGTTRSGDVLVSVASPIGFEAAEGFALGDIDGQQNWFSGDVVTTFDQAVVSTASFRPEAAFAGFLSQSFRIYNEVTSGGFSNQTYSSDLMNSVGETTATGFEIGTRVNHLEILFDFATTQTTVQDGLIITLSANGPNSIPNPRQGARMSQLILEDKAEGISVSFQEYVGGSGAGAGDFVVTEVATGLTRNTPHQARLSLTAVDGPSNDIVEVYIDDELVYTGTSWENYYRFDPEAMSNPTTRLIGDILIRVNGTAVPANAGEGFLIDNVVLTSFDVTAP